MMSHLWILAAGILLDRWIGDPDWLWRRLPHPVVWFGNAIQFADDRFNKPHHPDKNRRRSGSMFICLALMFVAVFGYFLSGLLSNLGWLGAALEMVLVAIFLAHNSLATHVWRVADGCRNGGLAGGRQKLSMIVGRDTSQLNESGIARGAIESLAENFSDGVVAPVFWYVVAGLPGLLAYKFLNTADSMIGHKTGRHLHFGRAAARLDDLVNWVPARLSALLVALAALATGKRSFRAVLSTVLRDAGLHRSPNAGWPEAAFSAALGLQLGGPRAYAGEGMISAPTLNASGRSSATIVDIDEALKLFSACGNCLLGGVLALAILL
ncbi:MAG: adenosylcobinamide-phosphate synthase CbiB [Pseudomonadota bacterium]